MNKKHNIYRLTTTEKWTNPANYAAGDAYCQMIVIAKDEEEARFLASSCAKYETSTAWRSHTTQCCVIGVANEEYSSAQVLAKISS